jgi:UDP-glucose 4-epimerase
MTAYGDTSIVPTPESAPCRPDSYYGITKHAAERFVHATAERPDLDGAFAVTSLRMFSVYGPGQALDNPYQGVLGIFIGNVLRGEPITIFGDGEQTRDFVYIDDIVEAWAHVLGHPAAPGGVFNFGSGRSLSINELARHVVAAFGFGPGEYEIGHAPLRPGEQRQVQADISRARSVLSWGPRTPFESGLAETVRQARAAYAGVGAVAAAAGTL